MHPIENLERAIPLSDRKLNRRGFLKLLGGVSLASLTAVACGPQSAPQVAPVSEAKPALNPPTKPEAIVEPPEIKRIKSWFNSVISGNNTEYKNQFSPNERAKLYPLEPDLSKLYGDCNINQADIKTVAQLPNKKLRIIVDFKKPCTKNGDRYIDIQLQQDGQDYWMVGAMPTDRV